MILPNDKEELTPSIFKIFQKNRKQNNFLTHSVKQQHYLIPKPGRLQTNIPDEYWFKNSQQNLSKPNSVALVYKPQLFRIIHCDQVGFILGITKWFYTWKSFIVNTQNRMNNKALWSPQQIQKKHGTKFNIISWPKQQTKNARKLLQHNKGYI